MRTLSLNVFALMSMIVGLSAGTAAAEQGGYRNPKLAARQQQAWAEVNHQTNTVKHLQDRVVEVTRRVGELQTQGREHPAVKRWGGPVSDHIKAAKVELWYHQEVAKQEGKKLGNAQKNLNATIGLE